MMLEGSVQRDDRLANNVSESQFGHHHSTGGQKHAIPAHAP